MNANKKTTNPDPDNYGISSFHQSFILSGFAFIRVHSRLKIYFQKFPAIYNSPQHTTQQHTS
jgi:hypothetical protein